MSSWVVVLTLGCATKREPATVSPEPSSPTATAEPTTPEPDERSRQRTVSPTAARIYMLGEERFAEGRYPEAVALWGHALLQLSPDASADTVRHKLLARMGHGLLQAYGATGDPSFLADGKAMCELYLAKHEALFGETEGALAERGDFYELLHEFEWRLEASVEAAASQQPSGAASAAAASMAEKAAEPQAQPEAEAEPTAQTVATAGVELDDGDELQRFIRVRRVQWAKLDDPEVQAYFRDQRFLGPSLLDYGNDWAQEPRVLVRVAGLPRPLDAQADAVRRQTARRLGFAVVDHARPALRRCYELAMTRDPVMAARVDVSLTVDRDGTVDQPLLVGGSLVDAEGDVCLAQALRDVALASTEHGEALAIAVPLLFFFQDAKTDGDITGARGPGYGSVPDPMPPIDEFDRSLGY